ncbi:10922_t:CDS:2 [Cetraspora pellucida]|uniref:10922_t:CDS:1 n=1 Tax=Cetraspora pellucida TaxID=1433469 RepID=A0A9N9CVD4_9GLOM|nr:10922_t:CDS:2 [Cetraspora pellucida]
MDPPPQPLSVLPNIEQKHIDQKQEDMFSIEQEYFEQGEEDMNQFNLSAGIEEIDSPWAKHPQELLATEPTIFYFVPNSIAMYDIDINYEDFQQYIPEEKA